MVRVQVRGHFVQLPLQPNKVRWYTASRMLRDGVQTGTCTHPEPTARSQCGAVCLEPKLLAGLLHSLSRHVLTSLFPGPPPSPCRLPQGAPAQPQPPCLHVTKAHPVMLPNQITWLQRSLAARPHEKLHPAQYPSALCYACCVHSTRPRGQSRSRCKPRPATLPTCARLDEGRKVAVTCMQTPVRRWQSATAAQGML